MTYAICCVVNEVPGGNWNRVRGRPVRVWRCLCVSFLYGQEHGTTTDNWQNGEQENKKKRAVRACSFPTQISTVVPTFLLGDESADGPDNIICLLSLIYQSTLTHCWAICMCWDRLARMSHTHWTASHRPVVWEVMGNVQWYGAVGRLMSFYCWNVFLYLWSYRYQSFSKDWPAGHG